MTPAAAHRTRWAAVLAATLTGVAVSMNVGKVPVSLPLVRAEFGLTLLQSGWVASTLTTLAMLSAVIVGVMAARLGTLRMVMLGLMCSVLGALAGLWATGYATLVASRFVEGAGFLFVAVSGSALVSAAAAAPDRRFALGVWSSFMPLGAGAAMALAPLLLPTTGWRGMWMAAAAVLLLAMALLWRQRCAYVDHTESAASAAPIRSSLRVLRQPLPWLLSLAFGAWAIQHFALIIWMPTYLQEQRGLSNGLAAGLTCLMLLANVPGNLIGGALVQRGLSRGRLIAVAQASTGLCGWLLFNEALPDGLRYALSVALSLVGGLIPAAVMSSSTVLARTPGQISVLQGLIMQGSQLGQFVGTPLIASLVASSGQWASARWVTGGSALIGVVMGLAAMRCEPDRAPHGLPT